MQPKESKDHKHFYISLVKSILRIMACVLLFFDISSVDMVYYFGSLFILAEVLGIAEEIF